MKVLIAMDSFKGSVSSMEAAWAVSSGIKKVDPGAEITCFPAADGGEGTLDTLVTGCKGQKFSVEVTGPLGEKVQSAYGWLPEQKVAVMELAQASGLTLVPEEKRDPLNTTSYGLGELIKDALDRGARRFVIAIGGSATNDGGMGMLRALGAKFTDNDGNELEGYGRDVSKVSSIDLSGLHPAIFESEICAACDVDNILCGANGATYVYGPQKGADQKSVIALDEALNNYGKLMEKAVGYKCMDWTGTGAAGGIGFAIASALRGELRPGTELILNYLGFGDAVLDADVVVTGEGCLDGQTPHGKVPCGVGRWAHDAGAFVIALAGSIGNGAEAVLDEGIDAYFPVIRRPMSLEEAMDRKITSENLAAAAEQVFRLLV